MLAKSTLTSAVEGGAELPGNLFVLASAGSDAGAPVATRH